MQVNLALTLLQDNFESPDMSHLGITWSETIHIYLVSHF